MELYAAGRRLTCHAGGRPAWHSSLTRGHAHGLIDQPMPSERWFPRILLKMGRPPADGLLAIALLAIHEL
jgi:hypothetical protein